MLHAEAAGARQEPVHRGAVECAGAPETVGTSQPRQQLQVDFLCQPTERAVPDVRRLVQHAWLQVVRHESRRTCCRTSKPSMV